MGHVLAAWLRCAIKPNAKIVPLKVSEASKVLLTVISDVPYFVEDNASCPLEKEPAVEPAADVPADGD